MTKMNTYQQCRLTNGNRTLISWIPSQYAITGSYLKLRDKDKNWEDGWLVKGAGRIALDEAVVRERETDHKRTRKASDI